MADDNIHISLRIGGRQFPMNVRRDDEYHYREAEKLINKTFAHYADRYPRQGNDIYLLMTLLDIAVKHKKLEAAADTSPLIDTVQRLVDELESKLNT